MITSYNSEDDNLGGHRKVQREDNLEQPTEGLGGCPFKRVRKKSGDNLPLFGLPLQR